MDHPEPDFDLEVEELSAQHIATLVADCAALLGESDVRRVLELALAAGRRVTGARYAAIGILDQARTGLARFETSGIDEATRRMTDAMRVPDPPAAKPAIKPPPARSSLLFSSSTKTVFCPKTKFFNRLNISIEFLKSI